MPYIINVGIGDDKNILDIIYRSGLNNNINHALLHKGSYIIKDYRGVINFYNSNSFNETYDIIEE